MKNNFVKQKLPAFLIAAVTGIATAVVVALYKLLAGKLIALSEAGYTYAKSHLWLVLPVLTVLVPLAFFLEKAYHRVPNLRGGGIPTSIGVLRGLLPFKWWSNLIGVFVLSLTSFLIGVPLGNEGPSVQMGTAVGRGVAYASGRKNKAWDRYAMTGGACSGFSCATGAPISGVMFAIEEAHQRVSPLIIIVSATSVMFSYITTQIISPLLGVSTSLFPGLDIPTLELSDIWLPLLVGMTSGIFAVLFLRYYKLINSTCNKALKQIPVRYKILAVYVLTIAMGFVSYNFISTGHDLILELFEGNLAPPLLIAIVLIRSTLTLGANSNRITGGIFLPMLAIGTAVSAAIGKLAVMAFGLSESEYLIIVTLGVTACIAGMMKMPLTAIVFSVEALSCYNNILPVILVSCIAFFITELFDAKSINDEVLENRLHQINEDKELKVIDTFVDVHEGTFAVGKQIRDIFWPANLFILSVHYKKTNVEVDEHGSFGLRAGDELHVRYSTYDEVATKNELMAIVGEQEYSETETDVI